MDLLQSALGNAGTARLARYLQLKAELAVGAPGDRFEREAAAVADRVMAMPEPVVQRQGPEVKPEEEEEPKLRRADAEEEEEPEVQAKGGATPVVTPQLKAELEATRGSGAPLSRDVRAFMEPRFGRDFGAVRVHTGGRAAGLARQLRAQAFTRGADVYFASGKYAPETAAGKRLLAHELVHVGQQNRGRNGLSKVPVIRRKVDPKKVSCGRLTRTASGRRQLKKLIGTTDPVGELQAADGQAIKMLDAVIKELDRCQKMWRRRGYLVLSPRPSRVNVFMPLWTKIGTNPYEIEVWTSRRYRTRKGQPTVTLLLKRLGRLRYLLNGGWIWYVCLGGICHKKKGAAAYAYYKRFGMYLCRPFWIKFKAADRRGLFLIHEAFHIYYWGTDQPTGIWSAYGIEGFVADSCGVSPSS